MEKSLVETQVLESHWSKNHEEKKKLELDFMSIVLLSVCNILWKMIEKCLGIVNQPNH